MQRDDCQAKLNRATTLMNSLGNERERWLRTSQKLLEEKHSLLGDILLTTAFITYLGPFEGTYRELITLRDWKLLIESHGILVGNSFSLEDTVGNISQIQNWKLRGLPSDKQSIENMIIMTETKSKWPLIIDPQGQALKFIKDLLDNDFVSIKL